MMQQPNQQPFTPRVRILVSYAVSTAAGTLSAVLSSDIYNHVLGNYIGRIDMGEAARFGALAGIVGYSIVLLRRLNP